MTSPAGPMIPIFDIEELDLERAPELSLLAARRAIEIRLEFLARITSQEGADSDPLKVLLAQGTIDRATAGAVQAVLEATDPISHGERVSPSAAASIASSAGVLVRSLDDVINSATRQVRAMPPSVRLSYAYLGLPSRLRRSIAEELEIAPSDARPHERAYALEVFRRAKAQKMLATLWAIIARDSPLIDEAETNPFMETS